MSPPSKNPAKPLAKKVQSQQEQERLARALKANLARRKAGHSAKK
jgi:hypothetical protein